MPHLDYARRRFAAGACATSARAVARGLHGDGNDGRSAGRAQSLPTADLSGVGAHDRGNGKKTAPRKFVGLLTP